jgi:hypothetical protein
MVPVQKFTNITYCPTNGQLHDFFTAVTVKDRFTNCEAFVVFVAGPSRP